MTENITTDPFSTPKNFREYVYNDVILALETKKIITKISKIDRNVFRKNLNINIAIESSLPKLQAIDLNPWPNEEFIFFHKSKGDDYSILFKRLRDTFAHGHYEQQKNEWITMRHRYKDRGDKQEKTRLLGNIKIKTLKNLISFLGEN